MTELEKRKQYVREWKRWMGSIPLSRKPVIIHVLRINDEREILFQFSQTADLPNLLSAVKAADRFSRGAISPVINKNAIDRVATIPGKNVVYHVALSGGYGIHSVKANYDGAPSPFIDRRIKRDWLARDTQKKWSK